MTYRTLIIIALVLGMMAQTESSFGQPLTSSSSTRTVSWHSSSPLQDTNNTALLFALFGDDPKAYLGFFPQIVVSNSRNPNAYAVHPSTIVVTQGLLDLVHSQAELAFVLAHEVGHLVLERGGTPPDSPQHHTSAEIAADTFALKIMEESGFRSRDSVDLVRRIASTLTLAGINPHAVYPLMETRVNNLLRTTIRRTLTS